MSFKDIQIVRESREAEGDFSGHPRFYLLGFHKENSLNEWEEKLSGYDVTINSETDSVGVGFCSLDLCE